MKRSVLAWLGGMVVGVASLGLAGCGGSGGGTGGTGATGGSGGADGGSGGAAVCGGLSGATCGPDEYCDFPMDDCGATDATGECKPRPEACDKVYTPVCTCAGTVAGNDCEAYSGGQDLSITGGCAAPEGMFACGAGFCVADTQYCQRTTSDIGGWPDSYGCRDLPAACSTGPVSCDCLAGEVCGSMCAEADGGFTLTCPGG